MADVKQNDLMATLMFQPEMSINDLYTAGITPDNTSLKDKSYYKDLEPVKEFFKNDDGKFDESKFNSFYDSVSLLYNDYSNKVAVGDIVKNYKYDPFDWRYVGEDTVDITPTMSFEKNPMRDSLNIKAMGIFAPSGLSIREIAQSENVFNVETGKFEDWTPNDKGGLFKSWARPTLVLATYDEDVDEPDENGRIVHHKKGEYKYHPITGRPYYETLGNREIYDKDVLHISDTLTKEGTKINKFDFFDSDGLDKSVGGTIAKMAVTLTPAVLGAFSGPVGMIYGGLSAAIALSQLVPTLGKAINGFFTNDNLNTSTGRALNTAEAWAARFARSTSDHSREHAISMENAASLITDISMQLFQQRSIQYIPRLFKNNPNIYNNAKLARTLSYGYMSGTSALESYSAFKQAGADDRVAGLGMFATIGAFYKLMSIDYFRDSFFKGSWFDDNNVKSPVWNVADDFMKAIQKQETAAAKEIAKDVAENTAKSNKRTLTELTKRFVDAIKRTGKPWRPSTFLERSFAEGTEEVMEEAFQDAIKATFKGAEALGIPMNKKREELNFGFSGRDFIQRYGMSFAGGFLGGAIFQGYNALGEIGSKSVTSDSDAHLSELVKLVADGRTQEIKDVLEKWHASGRFGSKNLSATKLATVTGVEGDTVVASEKGADDMSQNDFVYRALLEQIDYVDRVLSEEGFKTALADYQKTLQKINPNIESSEAAGNLARQLSLHSLVLVDLNRLGKDILRIRAQIDERIKALTPASSDKDSKEAKETKDKRLKEDKVLKDLNEELDRLRKDRDAITNGNRTSYYVSQYKLLLDGQPLQPLLGFSNINSFIRARYHKDRADLSETQYKIAEAEYKKYKDGELPDVFSAIDIYNALSGEFADNINNAEKSLSGATVDSDLTTEIIGNTYLKYVAEKDKAETRLRELEAKETKTEEETKEISDLNEKIDKYKALINSTKKDTARILANVTTNADALIEKLQSVLIKDQSEVGDEIVQSLANDVKEAYKKWGESKTLKRSQAELDTLYLLFKKRGLSKAERWEAVRNWLDNYIESERGDYETQEEVLRRLITGKELSDEEAIKFDEDNGLETDTFFNWDNRTKRPVHEKFENLLSKFYEDLGGDEATVLADYDEIVSFLKSQNLSDAEIKSLLHSDTSGKSKPLIPTVGGMDLIQFLKDIQELKSKTLRSVLPELLASVTTRISDTSVATIFEMLDYEQRRLASKSDLDDYTMDEIHEAGLLQSLYILEAIKGLLIGASNGTNSEINKYKKDGKYAEISKETAALIGDDIDEYINRISFLLKLNAANKGMKLSEHKHIAVNMRVKFLEKLTDAIHSEPFKDKFTKVDEDGVKHWVDPKALWEEEFKPSSFDTINVDNYEHFEPTIIAYETALFNKVKELGFTDEEIVDKIISIFGDTPNIWKQTSSKLQKDPDANITDYDFALYLLSTLTLNTNDFYVKLKSKIDNFDKAPLYGHEYIVRTAYSMFINPKAFNYMLDKIQATYKGSSEYVKNRRSIHNVLFGFGGAGTGKSTSVARLFKALTEDLDTSYIYMASDENQVKILTNSVEAKDSEKRCTYKKFFSEIAGDQLSKENIIAKDDGTLSTVKPLTYNDWTDLIDASANNTIIICDEIETLNELQLQMLSKYAEDKGIFVLALGDYKQPTGKVVATNSKGNVKIYNSGIEDLAILRTPGLTASLRTLSLAKNDNYNKLDLLVDDITRKIWEEPEVYTKVDELNGYVTELTKSGITLDYYVEGNRMVGDRIVKEEEEFKKNLDTALNIGGDTRVLIVTDSDTISKYQSDKYKGKTNVVVASIDEALGGEFDYVFVDIGFDKDSLFEELQKFYMLTQRSRLYTAVLDTGRNYEHLHLKSKENVQSNIILQMNPNNIADFKAWRLKGISELIASPTAEINLKPKDFTSKPTPPPPPPSAITPTVTPPEPPTPGPPAPTITPPPAPATPPGTADTGEAAPEEEPSTEPPTTPPVPPVTPTNPATPTPFTPKTPTKVDIGKGSVESTPESEISRLFDRGEQESTETTDFITSYVPNTTLPVNVRLDEYYSEVITNDFLRKEKGEETSLYRLLAKNNKTNNLDKLYGDLIIEIHKAIFNSEGIENVTDAINSIISSNRFNLNLDGIRSYLSGETSVKRIVLKANRKGSDIYLRLLKSDNDFIDIYVGKSTINKNGIYTGWFTQVTRTGFEKGKRITIAELKRKYPGLTIISSAGILLGDEAKNMTDAEKFAQQNNGKTFIAVGETQALNPNDVFRVADSRGKVWTYSMSDKIVLAGIQKALSQDSVCRFLVCWDWLKWEHPELFISDVSKLAEIQKNRDKGIYKYAEQERRNNLSALGYLDTYGKPDVAKILDTLARISGNSAWLDWYSITKDKSSVLSTEDKKHLLNEGSYLATPATMSEVLARVLDEITTNPEKYSESNLWYNLRRQLCTNIGSQRLWIKTKDGKVYQLAATEEPKSDADGRKLYSRSWQILDENDKIIVGAPYGGNVGMNFGVMLKGLFNSAGIDLSTSKALLLQKRTSESGAPYWGLQNTNQVLIEFIAPFISNTDKITTLFKNIPMFYANIYSDQRVIDGPWKLTSLENMEEIYTTDASLWHYSTYFMKEDDVISEETTLAQQDILENWTKVAKPNIVKIASQILSTETVNGLVNYYENIVNPTTISTNQDMKKYIDDFIALVNNQIKAETNTIKTRILSYDHFDSSITYEVIDTKDQAIINALEKNKLNPTRFAAEYRSDDGTVVKLFDALRTGTINNSSISILRDQVDGTTFVVYFNNDNQVVLKSTGSEVGLKLSNILQNLNSSIIGLTEKYIEVDGEMVNVSDKIANRERSTIQAYLLSIIKGNTTVDLVNDALNIMEKYKDLYNQIADYLESRIISDLDEC